MLVSYRIRTATISDVETIRALLPRLAAFDLPSRRAPEDLWRSDEKMLMAWQRGEEPNMIAHVAVEETGVVLGVVLVRLGGELLSHEPSAHLEVLVVAEGEEGQNRYRSLFRRDNGLAP